MLRGHGFHAIEDERKLEIERMLAPQRPVVIEDGDPLFGLNELRPASRGHCADKIEDALFRGTLVPGRKRIAVCHVGLPVVGLSS
jgi:hypothetical protein